MSTTPKDLELLQHSAVLRGVVEGWRRCEEFHGLPPTYEPLVDALRMAGVPEDLISLLRSPTSDGAADSLEGIMKRAGL